MKDLPEHQKVDQYLFALNKFLLNINNNIIPHIDQDEPLKELDNDEKLGNQKILYREIGQDSNQVQRGISKQDLWKFLEPLQKRKPLQLDCSQDSKQEYEKKHSPFRRKSHKNHKTAKIA